MQHRTDERPTGRLLFEFSRNEQVPKLVTYEHSKSKDARNRLLMQARTQINQPKHHHYPEISTLQHNLVEERQEKEQLRTAIRQLSSELHKLREVNEGLIVRIKEVENAYRGLRTEMEQQQQQQRNLIKKNIYQDIQEYIKTVVERLTINLKIEKMTPTLENKLEKFMAELMEINPVSVEQLIRKSRITTLSIRHDPSPSHQSRISTLGRYVTDYKTNTKVAKQNELPSREHYASIMQRLTGDNQLTRSYVGPHGQPHSHSHSHQFKTTYATTPSKRRRIFE